MAQCSLKCRPRYIRGWRRRVMCCSLALLIVVLVISFFVTRPQRLAGIVAGGLEWLTGAEVHIDRAYLSLDGELQLEGLSFAVRDLPAEVARLGDVEVVRVTPNFQALWRGQVRLRSIVLLQPTIYLTRGGEDDIYNYQHLFRPAVEPGQELLIRALPELFIRHGTLRFAEMDKGHLKPLSTMNVEGRLTRDTAEPTVYRFALRQEGDELLPGVVFHGSLDLSQQRVSTELRGFQFTEQQQQLLPAELRAWWRRLAPSGEMPTLTLSYDQAPDGGLDAELRMQNVAMNMPVPGIDSRMRDVTGILRLRGERLTIEHLTGEIEGIRYRLEGDIEEFELDAPMWLRLVTETFEIDQSPPPYLADLPDVVQRHYARYQPTGRFQTTFEMRREEAGGPLTYDGVVNVLGARGRYERFDAPVHDLHGQVFFSDKAIRIVNMRGHGPSGGEVLVEGTVSPPGRNAQADIRVKVRSVPVDDYVLNALKPKERAVVSMFMHEPGHAKLVASGLVRDKPLMPWQWRARVLAMVEGDMDRPVFALGGRLHADVRVVRAAGPDQPLRATIQLEPDGPVRLLFEHWPYPLQMTAGRVVIEPETVHLESLHLRGLTGAAGIVNGQVWLNTEQPGDIRPDLTLSATGLMIDPLLLASIASPQDRWIRQLGIEGELNANGTITDDAAGETDFAITFDLINGRAQPFASDFNLTNATGQFILRRDSANLEHFTARREKATFTGSGMLDWAGDEPAIDLALNGESLAIERALADLLPADHPARARMLELLDTYQPTGLFDAELYIGERAGPEATTWTPGGPGYRLLLRPRTLGLTTTKGEAVHFHELTGHVTVMNAEAELETLTARFDAGTIAASGPITLDGSGAAALQLGGQLDRLDGPWMQMLPAPLRDTLSAMNMQGQVALEHGRLLIRSKAKEGPLWEVAGLLRFTDTHAKVGVSIEELVGELTFDLSQHADEPMPRISLLLEAERLLANDRIIAPLTLNLRSDDEAEALRIETLHGNMYDGVLVGSGLIDLQSQRLYQIDLALQDVLVDPFIAAPDRRQAEQASVVENNRNMPPAPTDLPAPAATPGTGRLNASFVIQGEFGDIETRRGRGSLEIRNARLYERPVTLALLQAVNLSLPFSDAFDRGHASFLLEGDTIYLDELLLEAPSLAIQGGGTMRYATGELDLYLRARNPGGPHLGVISDMINLVKDQLVAIRITGTMEKPRARVVGLEDISRPWAEAFTPQSNGQPLPTNEP